MNKKFTEIIWWVVLPVIIFILLAGGIYAFIIVSVQESAMSGSIPSSIGVSGTNR